MSYKITLLKAISNMAKKAYGVLSELDNMFVLALNNIEKIKNNLLQIASKNNRNYFINFT